MLLRLLPTRTLRELLPAAELVVSLLALAVPLAAQDSQAKVLVQVGMVSIMKGRSLEPISVGQSIQTQQLIPTAPGNASTVRQGESIRVLHIQPLAALPIDKVHAGRKLREATGDAVYQIFLHRPSGIGAGSGGSSGSAPAPRGSQGDQGKSGG